MNGPKLVRMVECLFVPKQLLSAIHTRIITLFISINIIELLEHVKSL